MCQKEVLTGSSEVSFITNQAVYIGGKVTVNPNAGIEGTFLNCCKSDV